MSNVAGKAYAMNVLTPVSPALTWIQRLIFMASRSFPVTLSGLLNLSLIHFARWVIIKRDQWPEGDRGKPNLKNDYVLFCSNFNGTWDQYIDAFSDGIPQGLDLFWYASFKYPHSIPITAFKNYIVHNEFDTGYYYNATPGSGQRDIKAALKVLAEMKSLADKHNALDAQSFSPEYNKALARVQNCLGSPGYAPIASLDTAMAEQNRSKFLNSDAAAIPAAVPRARKVLTTERTTSFDGGHCFLTVLLPVKTCEVVDSAGTRSSHVYLLREALAMLPTAHQSQPTEAVRLNSPFARSKRTHFARIVVIDDTIFNGPVPSNTLVSAVRDRLHGASDGAVSAPVDQLPCPYLLFSVDCDATDETELHDYLCELWEQAGPALQPVLANCHAFDNNVTGPDAFADYIREHKIETTMPFNDYWTGAPQLKSLSIAVVLALAIVAGLVWGVGITFGLNYLGFGPGWSFGGLVSGLVILASTIFVMAIIASQMILGQGRRPFPAAPNSDLKSVLKALYLQRQLIRFAVRQQQSSAPDLHTGFGDFLKEVQLTNLDQPTQAAGTISGVVA
jgi:hypothetical protein